MKHANFSGRRGALLGLSALALLQAAPRLRAGEAPTPSAPPKRGNQMPAETIRDDRVESFALDHPGREGEPRWRIHLAKPRGKPPAAGYPIVYLLDGNASFPAAWHGLAALRAARPELAEALDTLVLAGIGYPSGLRIDTPQRYRDFTPYTAEEFRRARGVGLATGEREAFLDFLAQPARAAIASRLPIDPRRQALFGHSLGGLFTLHVLYNRPELFQTYVAGDPSLWWNGGSGRQEQAAFIAGARAAGGRLADPIRLLVENSGPARADTPAAGLAALDGLSMWHRQIEDASHGSMFGPATADALLFALGQVPPGARKL